MNEHQSVVQYYLEKDNKISDWTNEEVILFHTVVHSSIRKSSIGKLNDVHKMVVGELTKRHIGHSSFDKLDEV